MDQLLKYPNLFKPIRLGNTMFRNRIFSAPTGLYDLTPQRAPTERFIEYFARKAKGGAASVNIGECYVDDVGIPHDDYEVIHLSERKDNHNRLGMLANAISRNGAVATIELQKPGMVGSQSSQDDVLIGPSDGPCIFNNNIQCRGLTEEEIYQTIDAFADAAVYAKNRGFGMVMIHAGHGWLLHQFLSPITNKRTDQWGGSIENRARLTVAIIDEIHKRCGAGFPVEVRMSGAELLDGGFDIRDGVEIARQLDGHANLIHVSVGNIFGPTMLNTHPGIFQDEGMNVKYAEEIRKHVKTPVATIGGLSDLELMEEIIASGKADVVEMARGLICDPDLPNKARSGREKEVYHCLRCFNCVGQDYQDGRLFCALNPASGKEREALEALPPTTAKKVLIAGGGIAGMQAALTAAEQGHKVILCEKTDRVGGVLLCEEEVPFKKRVKEYIQRQRYMLSQSNVELRLNTTVTPELARKEKPDILVAAIGARPWIPPIAGADLPQVKTAEAVFIDPSLCGDSAVILGAGLTGLELAIYLSALGKKVEIVEMRPEKDAAPSEGYIVQLEKCGIKVRYGTKATAIAADHVDCAGPDGAVSLHCDTVILAMGVRPLWDDVEALSDCAPEFHQIGDCRTPRNILATTSEAWTIARNIGRY